MSTTNTARPDVYSRVTDKIIADLEQGVRPWMRPWDAEHTAGKITRPLRHNGIPYKGINVVMLWSASVVKGYGPRLLVFMRAPTARNIRGSSGFMLRPSDHTAPIIRARAQSLHSRRPRLFCRVQFLMLQVQH